jgi:hypothetical protein
MYSARRHSQIFHKGDKMKRFMLLAVVLLLSQGALWAQETPKAEVFGGFSILSISDEGERTTPLGWQASVAGNVTDKVGIVGDFGGGYKDGFKIHSYLGGVRFGQRQEKVTPFVHAMFGGTTGSDGTESSTGFTMAYGGGVDVNTSNDRVAIRVVQFDWAPTRIDGLWVKNIVRFGFGIVFKSAAR